MLAAGGLLAAVPSASGAGPRVRVGQPRVAEGDVGTTTVRLVLRLARPAPSRAGVRYRTRPGTALAQDFEARSGRIRFRRGKRRAVIVLRVRGDRVDEPVERFTVRLSRPRRVRLGRVRTATVTVVDDDVPSVVGGPPVADEPPVVVGTADAATTEPASAGEAAGHGLAVHLSRAAAGEVRVDYSLAHGTAGAGDVDLQAGTIAFAPGETSKAVPGTVRGDDLDEPAETASLTLSGPVGAQLGDADAVLTILDDPGDHPPALSVGDVVVSEPGTAASVPVTLSAASGRLVSVAYSTQDGAADTGDYAAASGRLTVPAGATRGFVDVRVTDDARDEDAQSFTLSLSEPDGASIADGVGTVTIEDDDAPPTVSIDDVTVIEGPTAARFTVTLSAPSEKPISLRADTGVGGTATSGAACSGTADYVARVNAMVTFDPGATSQFFDVQVCGDLTDEAPTETASVTLSSLVDAAAGDLSGLLTILDNDD